MYLLGNTVLIVYLKVYIIENIVAISFFSDDHTVLKIDTIGQAEAWRMVASKFNRVPSFIYTKTKASKKVKLWEPNPKALEVYLKINEIGERDFKEAMKHNPTELKHAITVLEKQMSDDVN